MKRFHLMPHKMQDMRSRQQLRETGWLNNLPLSQPYWLRQEPTIGMYQVASPEQIGAPENEPVACRI